MATKLQIYNGALRNLKETRLTSLTEAREARYLLDDVYGSGAVRYCLEQGLWRFAIRARKVEADSDIDPEFGYEYAFAIPSDHVRTVEVSSDEYFSLPLLSYRYENGYWYSDVDTIYIRYVSDDASYGGNLSLWSEGFRHFFELYLAWQISGNFTGAEGETIEKKMRRQLSSARSKDAMNEPAKFKPIGRWVAARMNGYNNEPDLTELP